MSESLDQQLLGHLLGALDDDEQEALDARLEYDEQCCRRLAAWRRRLASLEAVRPDFEPPPGLAERTCRYVAACMPASASKPRMTPQRAAPTAANAVRWPDLAAVALVLVMVTAVVFPAITHSRFHARVASCQDGLRQFGVALSEYGDRQHSQLAQFANGGRLTDVGATVARQLRDEYSGESPRDLCPDAWLAAQGISINAQRHAELPKPLEPVDSDEWLGTRRDGTDDGWQLPLTAAPAPLLADAPSADLPSQAVESHGGYGRNVLFVDGHTKFIPAASVMPANWVLSRGDDFSGPTAPSVFRFVSGH